MIGHEQHILLRRLKAITPPRPPATKSVTYRFSTLSTLNLKKGHYTTLPPRNHITGIELNPLPGARAVRKPQLEEYSRAGFGGSAVLTYSLGPVLSAQGVGGRIDGVHRGRKKT